MVIVGQALVSEELFEEFFVCDLNACKGECCVQGESGAPLNQDELPVLEEIYQDVKPFMRPEGIDAIERLGLYTVDSDGDFVTTLVAPNKECVFVTFDERGIAKCALEQAYLAGVTTWKKPISCHLYPIRLAKLPDFTAVNYHRWQVCSPARSCGKAHGAKVYQFLKEPLVRKFGNEWYAELEEVAMAYIANSEKP